MHNWLDDAVFYEVYPQSFMDSNADGIGDIRGIISRLDYIKSLGCNAIWINPLFESPFGDAGYDVSDYYMVAPRYGTNEDLRELFETAHAKGLHILLDLVPGHTSTEHRWFKESMKAQENEYTDRYVWTDSVWEEPSGMSSIKGISDRDGVCAVNFFSHQPALNYGFYRCTRPWHQPMDAPGPRATLNELMNIMRFWLGLGCDGFRVDMAGSLVKHDEDSKGTIKLWQEVRAFLDREFPDAVMVSEWGEPDKSLLGGFHMDFLLHFGPSHYNDLFRCGEPYFSSRGNGSAKEFVSRYKLAREKAGSEGLICIPSGNHDMDRLARHLTPSEMKVAFAFLLTMPGAPFIYYGDEIGMRYIEGLSSVEGGYGRTGSRSPMQWDNTPNHGFSSAPSDRLYIKTDSSQDAPTVASQLEDKGSLYNHIKTLIRVRREHSCLMSRGSIEFIEDGYPLIYIRSDESESLLVIVNPRNEQVSASLPFKVKECVYQHGGEISISGSKALIPASYAGILKI